MGTAMEKMLSCVKHRNVNY